MKEFISHFSAAYSLGIPYLDQVLGSKYSHMYKNNQFVDISVTDIKMLHRKNKHMIHLWKAPIPRGAIIKIGSKSVSSPELLFLQLANKLDFHRLILLGLQLCSYPPGDKSQSITTKRKLKDFLRKTPGIHGHKKAELALTYIENGSHSIMESILFMILTLPYRYGGYGLADACFNYEIFADEKIKKHINKSRFYADIYYKDAKLAIEYDSTKHHSNSWEQGRDSFRASALEILGIEVMRMTTIQLYNKDACELFAKNVAISLEKRLRHNTNKFHSEHNKIRSLLPRTDTSSLWGLD